MAAKNTNKADVEKFVQEYVLRVAQKDLSKVAAAESFKEALEDDAIDLAACAESSCKVVLRRPVKMKEYDEDDADAPTEDMFEVQLDIFKSGKVLARRSGCYMILKKAAGFEMQEYQYECTE